MAIPILAVAAIGMTWLAASAANVEDPFFNWITFGAAGALWTLTVVQAAIMALGGDGE